MFGVQQSTSVLRPFLRYGSSKLDFFNTDLFSSQVLVWKCLERVDVPPRIHSCHNFLLLDWCFSLIDPLLQQSDQRRPDFSRLCPSTTIWHGNLSLLDKATCLQDPLSVESLQELYIYSQQYPNQGWKNTAPASDFHENFLKSTCCKGFFKYCACSKKYMYTYQRKKKLLDDAVDERADSAFHFLPRTSPLLIVFHDFSLQLKTRQHERTPLTDWDLDSTRTVSEAPCHEGLRMGLGYSASAHVCVHALDVYKMSACVVKLTTSAMHSSMSLQPCKSWQEPSFEFCYALPSLDQFMNICMYNCWHVHTKMKHVFLWYFDEGHGAQQYNSQPLLFQNWASQAWRYWHQPAMQADTEVFPHIPHASIVYTMQFEYPSFGMFT